MTDGPTPTPPEQPVWPAPQPTGQPFPAPSPQTPPPAPQPNPGWTPPAPQPVPSAPSGPPPGWTPMPAPAAPQAPSGWQPQPGQMPPVQPGQMPPAQPGQMPPAQQGWQAPPSGWQPGGPPVPPPAGVFVPGQQGPKKRRKWPWVLLGIFLLMVLGIGACTAFVFKAVSGPTDFANTFAEQLYSNPAGAAQELCSGAQVDAAAIQQAHDNLVANGWTGDKRLYGAQVNSTNGTTTGAVSGTLGTSTVTIEMAKNSGDWCVTNFTDATTLTQVPDISIPDISIPDISIPDLSIPDITVPELQVTPAT